MASTVYDVANYILDKKGPMSTWKLQKLCYYAQAWTLAWEARPLFHDEFEAWANGPVCPGLFEMHKGQYMVDHISKGSHENLSEADVENIDIVLEAYGDKDPYWLREQTHAEDPWREARGDTPEGAPSKATISKDSMGRFYGSL